MSEAVSQNESLVYGSEQIKVLEGLDAVRKRRRGQGKLARGASPAPLTTRQELSSGFEASQQPWIAGAQA